MWQCCEGVLAAAGRKKAAISPDAAPKWKGAPAAADAAAMTAEKSSWASPVPYSPGNCPTWQNTAPLTPLPPLLENKSVDSTSGRTRIGSLGPDDAKRDIDRRRNLREIELAAKRLDSKAWEASAARKVPFLTEQLLASPGALPKAQLPAERSRAQRELIKRILQELPKNACAADKISKVPRRLLLAKGADGQHLRRELLRGANVVIFTAGYEGKRFIFERCHELGINVHLIEHPDSWAKELVGQGIVKQFLPLDMSQSSDDVYYQALSMIENLCKDPKVGEVDGVCTFVELSVPMVARLAEALALPGMLPEAVDVARDKHATREAMKQAGLPTPPNYLIKSAADLEPAAKIVGFPAVMKPISGAASLGVKKVESKAQLKATYEELDAELRSLVVSSGALVKKDDSGAGVDAGNVIGSFFVLEYYLDGAEVDVDVVMSEGEWVYAAVSDNGPTLEPYFNETWAVSPSLLPRPQQVALKELAIGAVKSLGFLDGVFHVECKYTSIGPHLIEVNARMGGGPVYATNLKCWGVCLVEETIFASVGIPSRPNVPKAPKECIANSDINVLKSGKLANLDFLKPLQNREGVISYNCHVQVGEEVVGPEDGLPTWLVEVVVSRSTPEDALAFLMQLEKEAQALVKLA